MLELSSSPFSTISCRQTLGGMTPIKTPHPQLSGYGRYRINYTCTYYIIEYSEILPFAIHVQTICLPPVYVSSGIIRSLTRSTMPTVGHANPSLYNRTPETRRKQSNTRKFGCLASALRKFCARYLGNLYGSLQTLLEHPVQVTPLHPVLHSNSIEPNRAIAHFLRKRTL